ncbi:MAG: hypothetical protein IPK60_07710 [Sandaracinaceae bacterium]|nr:hypothetical protein [Sandaracinaceae bacterium]
MSPPPHPRPHYVTVIAENRETIDGLHGYLQNAGVASRTSRALQDATAVPPAITAVVLFPDEFDVAQVVKRVSSLRATRPQLLIVVVTSTPQRFRPALDADPNSRLPIVLPKPAFGWTILDAIRVQATSAVP